jgi:predicted amidohydrolase YtcJ
MLIAAIGVAQAKYGDPGNRPVLIHGQFLREDEVDSYKRLGVFPSLFPMHTFYWGDWHRDHTVGPVNAENISPTGWVRQRDMMFGSHHDAPVAFPDSMRILSATVTRRTRCFEFVPPLTSLQKAKRRRVESRISLRQDYGIDVSGDEDVLWGGQEQT